MTVREPKRTPAARTPRSVRGRGAAARLVSPVFNGELTAEEVVFCRDYVADGRRDPVAAWISAFGQDIAATLPDDELERRARSLLRRSSIAAQIDRQVQDACTVLDISPARVLARWAQVAFADPRELAHVRRVNCRYCWGAGHRYQWTPAEFDARIAEAMQRAIDEAQEYEPPAEEGGVGYKANRAPHPDCPECAGEGVAGVYLADSGSLSPAGAALYAGVKATKYGYDVLTHDQLKALDALSKFFGLTPETVRLMTQPAGATGEGAFDDPETAADAYRRLMDGGQ